jgi:copper chaperone
MSITSTYDVVGMSCDHCARSVSKEIRKIDGVDAVDVDLARGVVTVSSAAGLGESQVASAVSEAGFALRD